MLVADDPRPPIAIRSLRPYATVEEFLAEERDTLTRTAVTLIGAPSRPRGVIIRFELTLTDGTPVLRGEGRVLGFQAADDNGPSALTLRFTRLDARSKALVDRAATLREKSPTTDAPPASGPATDAPPASTPATAPAQPHATAGASPVEAPDRPDTEPPPDPLATTMLGVAMPAPPAHPPSSDEQIALSHSSGELPSEDVEEVGVASSSTSDTSRRDTLLDQLRARAKTLTPTQVATILRRSAR